MRKIGFVIASIMLLASGCTIPQAGDLESADGHSIAHEYQDAPTRTGGTYTTVGLVDHRLVCVGPGVVDPQLFSWEDSFIGNMAADSTGGYAVSEPHTSSEGYAYLVRSGKVIAKVLGSESVRSEFTRDGRYWFCSSSGEFLVYDTWKGRVHYKMDAITNAALVEWQVVPGSWGRVVEAAVRLENGDLHRIAFDGVTRKSVHMPRGGAVWVDRGRLLVQTAEGISDLGRVPSVPVIDSRYDALGYSPWNAERSYDRTTFVVRSIFRGGPTWNFEARGVWREDSHLSGLHAFVGIDVAWGIGSERIYVYDLRTGKRAFRVEFSHKPKPWYRVTLPDGRVGGSHNALIGIPKSRIDEEGVMSVVLDVMRVSTSVPEP